MLSFTKETSQPVFVGHCFQTHSGSREQLLFLIFPSFAFPCLWESWRVLSPSAKCLQRTMILGKWPVYSDQQVTRKWPVVSDPPRAVLSPLKAQVTIIKVTRDWHCFDGSLYFAHVCAFSFFSFCSFLCFSFLFFSLLFPNTFWVQRTDLVSYVSKLCISMLWKPTSENTSC